VGLPWDAPDVVEVAATVIGKRRRVECPQPGDRRSARADDPATATETSQSFGGLVAYGGSP
jgi:hypothetical protein